MTQIMKGDVGELIVSKYVHSRINQHLIAGCFGPKVFVSCVQN